MPETSSEEQYESRGIDLIYKIDGAPSDVGVFELARVLDALGKVLVESYHIMHPNDGQLVVTVEPFERGSFIMDVVLHIQQNPGILFALAHPEIIEYTKKTVEAIGLIKDVKEKTASLLELLRGLKNGKPEKIEPSGKNSYDFHTGDGAVIPVNSTVHALYNSPVINNYTFNIVSPAEKATVDGILTYLKDEPETSRVRISKTDAAAVRAYSEPSLTPSKLEVLDDTNHQDLKTALWELWADHRHLDFHNCGNKNYYQSQDHGEGFS